jgi:acyl carrier protein
MTRTEIEATTREILESFLGEEVSDETSRSNSAKWDSLQHMQIVFALEENFDVQFTEEEIPSLDSFEAIVGSLLKRHES